MRKIKSKKIFTVLVTSTLSISAALLVFTGVDNSSSSSQVTLSDANTTADTTTSTFGDSSLSFQDNSYSDFNTSIGYLTIEGNTISLISWFGNQLWTYDVGTSPFLTQTNIANYDASNITSLNVKYISNYNRDLVYGTISNSTTFVFQLNNSDGSEYYVNDNASDSEKISGSCLISADNSTVIGDANRIDITATDSALILPKDFDTTTLKVTTTQFSLVNYTCVSYVLDASSWKTNTSYESYLTDGTEYGEIIGISQSINSEYNYIAIKSSKKLSTGDYEISATILKLHNNIFDSLETGVFAVTSSEPDLDDATFDFVTLVTDNSSTSYLTMVYNQENPQAIEPGSSDGNSSYNSSLVYQINPDSESVIKLSSSTNDYINTNIYVDSVDSKVYLFLRNTNSANRISVVDLSSLETDASIYTISSFVVIPDLSTDSRYSIAYRPIFDSSTASSSKITGIYSVYLFSDTTSTTASKIITNELTIDMSSSTSLSITTQSFLATTLNSYQNLATDYYYYLPQDVGLDLFEKYIYLKYVDSSQSQDALFDSTVTYTSEALTFSNDDGTISGTLNLNLSEWWTDSSSTTYYTIPISINISGLATNDSLTFQIVTSSDVDATKWAAIENLKSVYPSQVTAQDILDYFISTGSSIKLTTADVSFNPSTDNQNLINVYTDDNQGTLRIAYNLNSVISPSVGNVSGEYTFNNFLELSSWAQITLNENAWDLLKQSKAPFQVTVADIISCLNLSSYYQTDESYWTWTPTYSETSNKIAYIDQNIDGTLTGTLSYNRTLGGTPDAVPESYTTLEISEDEGGGFVKLTTLMGSTNANAVSFDSDYASKIASSYQYSKTMDQFSNILSSSTTFYNNWTDSSYLNYEVVSSSDNLIEFNLSFANSIKTNFLKADGTNLVLDSDWISEINKNSDILTFDSTYSFSYNLTTVLFNDGLSQDNTTISYSDLVSKSSSYSNVANKFISSFYNSSTDNYNAFEQTFKLIQLPTDSTALNYYTISNVQMVANDTDGTVTVIYTIEFPNSGSTGSSIVTSVTIDGFKTVQSSVNDWKIACICVGAIVAAVGTAFVLWLLIHNYRFGMLRKKYGKGSLNKNLNLQAVYQRNHNWLGKKRKTSNTLNHHVLALNQNFRLNRNIKIKDYNKTMKELKKFNKIYKKNQTR